MLSRNPYHARPYQRAVQAIASLALMLTSVAQALPGELDATFGFSGRVIALFPTSNVRVGGMLIQPDGKIVVAAACGTTSQMLCVVRHLTSGVPDPAFGANGVVITADEITNSLAIQVVVQRDGKLVIGATCVPRAFCAIRINSDGSRDASFGTNGKAIITARTTDSTTAAFAEQRDGKLLFTGDCQPSAGEPVTGTHCVARLHANGALDTSFGVGGLAFVEVPLGIVVNSITAVAIHEQGSGKLVISGRCTNIDATSTLVAAACAFRRQSNGTPDSSYGVNGFASFPIAGDGSFVAGAAAMPPDDSVLIAGLCNVDFDNACVARFDANGVRDAALQTMLPTQQASLTPRALHAQRDGKFLAAGRCFRPNIATPFLCVYRYNADGSADTGLPPIVGTVLDESPIAVAPQDDGKIVVASNYAVTRNTQSAGLIRYEGGPFGNAECSLDIDGDGVFNPAIDGLMFTRVALGFTGPNVYAGISFASAARRTQWGGGGDQDIRQFLVSQCGMRLGF